MQWIFWMKSWYNIGVTEFQQQSKQARQWLKMLAKASRIWVMLSVGIGLFSGLLLITEMYCLSHIVYAAYIQHRQRTALTNYFVAIVLMVCMRAGLAYLKERVSFQASATIRESLRVKLLTHINQLGPIAAGQLSTAVLASSVMEQVESLHEFFAYYLPQMSVAVLMPAAILAFVFPSSIVCGVILLVCAPLVPFFMALVGMGAASLEQKHFQTLARMSVQFLDAIQGLVTLKLLGKSRSQTEKILMSSDHYRVKTMQVLKVAFLSSGVLELFSAGSIALIAVYLGMGFINGGMHSHLWHTHTNLQGALFILLLAPEFFLPLRQLGMHYHAKAKAIGAAVEIANVLALKPAVGDEVEKNPWKVPERLSLSFTAVTVSYQKSHRPALDNVTFQVTAQEKIAVLGMSGAGKTTLLNSVLKFVEPTSGCIDINARALSTIGSEDWYQAVSWLGQSPTLFHGTIRDNLLLAKPTANDQEILSALKFAELDQFVARLPCGIQTSIGDHHAGLSGGQARRLALARAYLKDAALLLLDEPTAGLDSRHEAMLWSSLESFWKNKTVLLLTHRLNHLENMDRVFVLDEGRLVKQVRRGEYVVEDLLCAP